MLLAALDPRFHHILKKITLVLKAQLSVSAVAVVVGLAMLIWVALGINQRGIFLLLWLTVPLYLVAASVCIGGPGRLFDKQKYEGRVVLQITRTDAVTMLDVVGVGFACVAAVLACLLINRRIHAANKRMA